MPPTRCLAALATAAAALAGASAASAQNHAPNPFRTVPGVWGQLPEGRTWGATSAVYTTPEGNVWVAERCGANQGACERSPNVDPVVLFSPDGEVLRAFGRGQIVWPHGMFVDSGGNVWIADAAGSRDGSMGHQVYKFSPEGRLLMSLGTKGQAGSDRTHFDQPCDVLVAPDGSIFVADGHGTGGNNRVVKFSADGRYLMGFGEQGSGDGQFNEPHALAMDSQGRLFVGDRHNNRVQIFDQQGTYIAQWSQFGRPSGIFIDKDDMIYVADSESTNAGGMYHLGWVRGIRIGSVRTGMLEAFIPDPDWHIGITGTSAAEGVAADAMGNVYGAEVGPMMLRKHVRVR